MRWVTFAAVIALAAASAARAVDPVISDPPAPAPSRAAPPERRPKPRPQKPRAEPASNKEQALALERKATAVRLAGDVSAAETLVRQALELDPDCANALGHLGCLLVIRGTDESKPKYFAEAMVPLKRAIALNPGDSFAHRWLGAAFMQSGDLAAAERSLKESLRLNAGSSGVWWLMASVRGLQQRYADAVACQRKGLEIDPNDAVATAKLGRFLALSGQPGPARAQVEKSRRMKSVFPADVQIEIRRAEEALAGR